MSDVSAYLKLPYTLTLRQDEEGDFIGRVLELPGCVAHGSTAEQALRNLREAQHAWIADAVEAGDPVPTPDVEQSDYSGRWLQRVPKSLHRRLSEIARAEQTSLNQLTTGMLSECVALREARISRIAVLNIDTRRKEWVDSFRQLLRVQLSEWLVTTERPTVSETLLDQLRRPSWPEVDDKHFEKVER